MRMNTALIAIVLATGAGARGAGAQVQQVQPLEVQQEGQDFVWRGQLAAGQTIEVRNIIGSIDAEPATGNQIEVRAVRRPGRYADIDEVRIEAVRDSRGVTICVVYPSERGREMNTCDEGRRDWNNRDYDARVNFIVRVPRGIHFAGNTISGSIEAMDLPANATVATVSGDIDVSAAGVVEAKTVSGSIDARMGTARPGRNLSFKTVSGSIKLYVPADFQADFEASSVSGDIESDFPIRIKHRRWVGVDADGRIGEGNGHALNMETVSGRIALLRVR